MNTITPDVVLGFDRACDTFLCELSDNIYDIRFGTFRIRDVESNRCLFEIERDFEEATEDSRLIQYTFPADFLLLGSIGTSIHFSVGSLPVSNFRIIEKHYFRTTQLQCYDFNIEFMIPNSVNSREFIYELPRLPRDLIIDMISQPYETKSDSFFFVENKLIMHIRAEYDYSG
jgi:protein unc-119